MVEVTLNATTKASLIIDTGASKTVFDKNFISPIASNIEAVEDNRSSGINAMIDEASVGTIDEFKIGDLTINNYQCLMLDLSHINELYKNYADKYIAGLLGSDFMVENKAIINYAEKSITFILF